MKRRLPYSTSRGFTLLEVLVASAIMGLVFAGLIQSHIAMSRQTEWSGYSIAAQGLAVAQVEQFRAATWDVRGSPVVDETTNLPTQTTAILDLPIRGTNVLWATNYIAVRTVTVSTNPPVSLKLITVSTVWRFRDKYFTNRLSS